MRHRALHFPPILRAWVAALLLGSAAGAADEPAAVDGYGPWRLGMTPEEVRAVAEHGPYTPVQATGGLEAANGEFMGRQANVSFVFGPEGLRHIQVWAYEGSDPAAAEEAFYETYRHLSERFGALHADGRPVPAGLSREEVLELVPDSFRDDAATGDLDSLEPGERLTLREVQRVHLHPRAPVQGAQVYASLLHNRELGLYWVFVYYKTPPGSG